MPPLPTGDKDVLAAVGDFKDPETGRSVASQGQLRDIRVQGDALEVTLALTTWAAPLWKQTREALAGRLRAAFSGLRDVTVKEAIFSRPPQKLGQIGLPAKSVIAVGSGKGGVGKSTISVSIALGLARAGAKVGLMDADVYGPSVPHLLGVNERPAIEENDGARRITPVMVGNMAVMSMGFMLPRGQAVPWRGPMLHGAITQFLRDTQWGEVDYLIIDMPPGTGDIPITLSQLLPLTGAVVVCTPQDVALLDAERAVTMFRMVKIPVLGMVENMSYFICPDTGKRYNIFGSGGARKKAVELEIPFLGEVPINISVRELGDVGQTNRYYDLPEVAPFLDAVVHTLVRNLATEHAAAPPLPQLSVL